MFLFCWFLLRILYVDLEYKNDAAQSNPSDPGWSHTSTIFNIAAFPLSFPAHTLTVASIKGTEQMEPYPSVQCKPLACIIHNGSSRNAAAAREKREERDSRDVLALLLLVALFPPVSPVSLESGIGDCSRSAHE